MTEPEPKCLIESTHDKYEEAFYFLNQMIRYYHWMHEFRFNLNAFIQAFRNITFMLQSEHKKTPPFDNWYTQKRDEMRSNTQLARFVEARNTVVKKRMLEARSKAFVGLFEGPKPKVGFHFESSPSKISPFEDNHKAMELAKKLFIGFVLDEEHSAVDEQLGIYREWIVDETGEREVVSLCIEGLNYMGVIVREAHELYNVGFEPHRLEPDMKRVQVLLETDLDPTLPKKWGWI